jgi:hypothetical protein
MDNVQNFEKIEGTRASHKIDRRRTVSVIGDKKTIKLRNGFAICYKSCSHLLMIVNSPYILRSFELNGYSLNSYILEKHTVFVEGFLHSSSLALKNPISLPFAWFVCLTVWIPLLCHPSKPS